MTEVGAGGACAITVEEQVEDYWSDENDQGELFEGQHSEVEADVDSAASKAALGLLLANGVVRDIPRAEGVEMKHLITRWERGWRKRDAGWEYKVRFVGRENKWQGFREDPLVPGASYCTGRIVDILWLKRGVPTFAPDSTDAYHQAPELEDVVVDTHGGVFETIADSGKVHGHLVETGTPATWTSARRAPLGRSFHWCTGGQMYRVFRWLGPFPTRD